MGLVLRNGLGRKLTTEELDGNFTYLEGLSGGGSTGGYQVLGSLVVDLTLATQSLTYPIIYVVTTDGDPQFNEGDIVNGSPNGVDITGTASVYSVSSPVPDEGKNLSIYRIELADVQGIIYDPMENHPTLICPISGANGEISSYYDSMGPDQEISLVGDYNVVKSFLLFNSSGDISSAGKLTISTGIKRSDKVLFDSSVDPDILSLFTASNLYIEGGIGDKGTSKLVSNKLYLTVNQPINVGTLTVIVYGYSLDSFV